MTIAAGKYKKLLTPDFSITLITNCTVWLLKLAMCIMLESRKLIFDLQVCSQSTIMKLLFLKNAALALDTIPQRIW